MKNIFLLILIIASIDISEGFASTGPEKILSVTVVTKSFNYYHQQAELWKKETTKSPQNGDAWWNYFLAARYANMFAPAGENPFDMEALVSELSTAAPNTVEYHYISYAASGRTEADFPHLLKAYEIAPDHPIIQHSVMTYFELKGNKEKVREISQRLIEAGEFSPGILKWTYNLLQSIEPNGVLLTWGDNDTYYSWALQLVENIRPDVTVLNPYLLFGHDDYRKVNFERAEIAPFEINETYKELSYDNVIDHILKNSKRPVYLAMSLAPELRSKYNSNLYMTGLAFKYSEKTFDNLATVKNNYENKFLKDHLSINFDQDISQALVDRMNMNYLPAMLRLFKHYKESGELLKAAQIRNTLLKVAQKAGKESEIEEYLGFSEENGKINSNWKAKEIEQGFVKIYGNIYAEDTELTNEKYEKFLMDLVKNKEFDKLAIAKTNKTDWRTLLPQQFQHLSDDIIFVNNPDIPEAPVQNISYEAAQLYCAWITEVYNQSTDKKKRFQKVVFRLPTEKEWTFAARGGFDKQPYPWGNAQFTNNKGCFLNNFDLSSFGHCEDCPSETSYSRDGGFFPVIADAYFPNNYGLYNVSGNVAEMIDTKGVAMGGSWQDKPENCKVDSKKEYTEATPSVGFRVFMEVIEWNRKN